MHHSRRASRSTCLALEQRGVLHPFAAHVAKKDRVSGAEYEAAMAGVYSSCVPPDTLDESPMAYKSMDEIVESIEPTAEILCRIKPICNIKAAE